MVPTLDQINLFLWIVILGILIIRQKQLGNIDSSLVYLKNEFTYMRTKLYRMEQNLSNIKSETKIIKAKLS